MKLDPRHLSAFSQIVERSSFTQAADALGTTQPALSRLVSDLEKRVGAPLLEQRRNPVTPTELGRKLADKGALLRGILAEAEAAVAGASSGVEGVIRLGAPPFFAEEIVPEVMLGFRRQRPKVTFEFHSAYLPELLDAVAQRRIDLALGPVGVEQARGHFDVRTFARLDHAIICRSGHPLLQQPRIGPSELSEAHWVSQTAESMLFRVMSDGLSSLGLRKINTVVRSDSGATLMRIIRQSDCLTVLPTFSALPGLRDGTLSIVPSERLPSLSFGATLHSAVRATPVLNALLEHLINVFEAQSKEISKLVPPTQGRSVSF